MNKKLYRAALISSPIMALIGNMPLTIIDKLVFPLVGYLFLGLTILILVFWIINIYIINRIQNPDRFKRYFISYLLVFILQMCNIFFLQFLDIEILKNKGLIFPFIPIFGINSLILILSNSIIFQFQKQKADIEIEQLKINNLEAQKHMLLQQLQPHFLFNALSTLKSLISENPSNAEDYTVRLSEFLRYSIQAKNTETVSLKDEMKFCADYIALQKVRFADSFDCQIDIGNEHMNARLPVYAVQTLIENAIKHNSFNAKKPLKITVKKENDNIVVSNNILEKTKTTSTGLGLKNLNLRYKMIANRDIEIENNEKMFVVCIPLL